MISTPAEYEVAVRNFQILEKSLESLRSQLGTSNPKLFSISSEAYLRRIAEIKEAIAQYESAGESFDYYTFVADAALQAGKVFYLKCNCGNECPLRPPLSSDFVVCQRCHSRIKFLILEGSPEYVVGATPAGQPMLLPVQGSTAREPALLSQEEQREAIRRHSKQGMKQSQKRELFELQAG